MKGDERGRAREGPNPLDVVGMSMSDNHKVNVFYTQREPGETVSHVPEELIVAWIDQDLPDASDEIGVRVVDSGIRPKEGIDIFGNFHKQSEGCLPNLLLGMDFILRKFALLQDIAEGRFLEELHHSAVGFAPDGPDWAG
jgi:hypothetical protein